MARRNMPAPYPPSANTRLSGPLGPLPAAFSRVLLRQRLTTRADDAGMTDARCVGRWAARWEAAYQASLSFVPAEPMEAMPAAQAVAVVLPERSRRTVRPDAGPDPPSIGPPPTGPT